MSIADVLASPSPALWVFAGDSITQGAEHTGGARSYPQHFEERLRYERGRVDDLVVNAAASGESSDDLLAAFDRRVARFRPAVVLVMIGTNDAAGLVAETTFRENLAAIVARTRATGAIPVLQTPPPVTPAVINRPRLDAYVAAIREAAAACDVALVDHHAAWMGRGDGAAPSAWMADGLHPNARGHAAMAATLFEVLGLA